MDFWHEQAMPQNRLCLYPDPSQGKPGSGNCSVNANFGDGDPADDNLFESCLTAVDLMAGRAPEAMPAAQRTRGGGCKNDGGPLWISVELAESPENIVSSEGGGDVFRTVWGRIFQKKQEKSRRRRRTRRSRYARYAQVDDASVVKQSELVECMALQICTATGGPST